MQSFRTELENPIVEKDIIELADKIELFKQGKVDEEKFRSLRLARGVYGQRQFGVQMIRIKLPYGKISSKQLHRIADVSDEYSRGRLHITTRQDIQIHHVHLDRTPELWNELERDDITLREACGNTVRNVTASETAGIDINEPFDVSPYADAVFKYFLRNPISQELGRKFKISFSATDEDTGLGFMHDLGFIAKLENGERGFKVLIGGGLGSQPRLADELYSFLPQNKIIPLIESVIRIFDRFGERNSRAKARLKFLIKKVGLEAFKELILEERKAIPTASIHIDYESYPAVRLNSTIAPKVDIESTINYNLWKKTNTVEQKQEGFVAIGIKVPLGDFYTDKARILADLVNEYAAGEFRLTLRQNILIPHIRTENLPYFYVKLKELGFATIGYNKAIDITACPGTDTCNLGISSSTGITTELERVLVNEYPDFQEKEDLVIKISGCMNACGQHSMAPIGFQGMTIKAPDKRIAPALQVLLGGGNLGDGVAHFADKVVKVPSKKGPQALRIILDDFIENGSGNTYTEYYQKNGEKYFYSLLKHLSDVSNLSDSDFTDWGSTDTFIKAIGVGECAGVVIDLISTLFLESQEKIDDAHEAIEQENFSDAIYYSYSSMINAAKAVLLSEKAKTNTQAGIVTQFDELFVDTKKVVLDDPFQKIIYQIKENAPSASFAKHYAKTASHFLTLVKEFRGESLQKHE